MKSKDGILRYVILGASILWILIGVWGINFCLETARIFRNLEQDRLGMAGRFDGSPYLFGPHQSVPYIAFATSIVASIFVIYSINKSDIVRRAKTRHPTKK